MQRKSPADWPGWFVADESRRVLASFSDRPEMPRIEVQATDQDIGHVFGEEQFREEAADSTKH